MKKYLRHRISNYITINEIFALEYRKYNGQFSNDTENHEFWEITYVESGNLQCNINDHTLTLETDEIVFIAPNTKHYYNQDSNTKVVCMCFECLSPFLKTLNLQVLKINDRQKTIIRNMLDENNNSFTINSNEQLVKLKRQPFGCMQIIILLLEHFILLSLRQIIDNTNPLLYLLPDKKFEENLTEKIKQYCFEHVKEKITLKNICDYIGYSTSFTCNLFKKQTKQTIFKYINILKIEEAKKLLAQTNLPAVKISYSLMYSDVKYFNTCFKNTTGLSPIEYRKRVKSRF